MNNTSNCVEFSAKVAIGTFFIKGVLWLINIFLGVVMISTIVIISRLREILLYRLLIYLMATNVLQGICKILEQFPIEAMGEEQRNNSHWHTACEIFASSDIMTTWITNFFMIWIVLLLSWYFYRLRTGHCNYTRFDGSEIKYCSLFLSACEIVTVLSIMIGTFFFISRYNSFIKDVYGISGPWCWRMIDEDGCIVTDLQMLNFGHIMTLLIPQFGCFILGSLCIIPIVGSYGFKDDRYQKGLRVIGMMFLYAIIHSTLSTFPWINRMYILKNASPNYLLWILHAVAEPSRIIILILALLKYRNIQKTICGCSIGDTYELSRSIPSLDVTPRMSFESSHMNDRSVHRHLASNSIRQRDQELRVSCN